MKDDAVEPGWFAWLQWLLAAIEMKSVVVDHIGDSLSGPLDQRKNRTEADDQQRERDPREQSTPLAVSSRPAR